MSRLILVRHAKSDYPAGVPDHDRPLAPRGRRDAPVAGEWLRTNAGPIEDVRVSTAMRTRQTWELLGLDGPQAVFDERLYDAAASAVRHVVLEADADSLLVVAHNPGLHDLATALAARATGDAADRLRMKFPTSAIAVFDIDGPLAELGHSVARLVDFVIPRG